MINRDKKSVLLTLLASLVLAGSAFASPTKVELDSHKKIVGYFPEWGVYSAHNNYAPSDIPFDKLTHINYAFARIINGEVAIFDDWAATGITFGEAWDSPYKGNLGQLKKLKSDFPDTSVLISVGGWTQSAGFHDAALTEVNRQKFADSCVRFVRQWGFDGIDIDWEFPTQQRQPDTIDTASDTGTPYADAGEKQTFTLLLKTIRETLDRAGEEDGTYYQLTAAVGASVTTINNIETDKYHKYLDFINIMSYDLHGAWENKTNHQSPLYSNPGIDDPYKLTIENAVTLLKQAGVPASKIVIGAPYYSRGWKGVQNNGPMPELPGLFATATGGAKGIWDGGRAAGINPYYHIKQEMENDASFTKYRDPYTKTPYLYSATKGEMYTYEDEPPIDVKANYVTTNKLGGVIFWELSADFPSKGDTLTTVLFENILNGTHPRYANASSHVTEQESNEEESVTEDVTPHEEANEEESAEVGSETPEPTDETETQTEVTYDDNGLAQWNQNSIYFGGERVVYNGLIYKASWWTQNNIPGSEMWGPWKLDDNLVNNETVSTEDGIIDITHNVTTIYDFNKTYLGGERVVYQGFEYEAQWWNRKSPPEDKLYTPWKIIGTATINITDSGNNSDNETTNDEETTDTQSDVEDDNNANSDDSTNNNNNDETTENEESSTVSTGAYAMSMATLTATENALTSSPLMQEVKASIATRPNSDVETITVLNPNNFSNVKRVESIISEGDWDYIFAKRSPEYTYLNFLKAVGKFPAFCGDYDDGRNAEKICRTSLATMFAHFAQETGGHTEHWDVAQWRQGLVHVREMGWNEEMRGGYNGECNPEVWQGQTWPCGEFENGDYKSYFGRGAKQLSYNYNYGPFSEAMTGDVRTLLDHPELVADTWYNLASAVFFFVYPQPPKPSMLHVVDGTWQPNAEDIAAGLTPGFGVTTQIINGGVECGGSVEVQQSLNRIDYYENFSNYLGLSIPEDEVLGCKGMQQFNSSGNGALEIYWEQDWGYDASRPEGKSYACKLVGYQTPFSAFKEGDYTKCVQSHFNIEITE